MSNESLIECVTEAIHMHEGNRLMLTHFQAECLARSAVAAMWKGNHLPHGNKCIMRLNDEQFDAAWKAIQALEKEQ